MAASVLVTASTASTVAATRTHDPRERRREDHGIGRSVASVDEGFVVDIVAAAVDA